MCEEFETPIVVEMSDEDLTLTLALLRERLEENERKTNELTKLVMAIDTAAAKPHSVPDHDVQKQIRAWGPIYAEAIVTQQGDRFRIDNVYLTPTQIAEFTAKRKPAPPPPAPC